jgi:hypothetical protein
LKTKFQPLNQQGIVQISEIDFYQSYINDIRVISNTNIEVDTCEVWSTNIYQRSDGALIQGTDPRLLPQTITIQKLEQAGSSPKSTFFDAPAFCQNNAAQIGKYMNKLIVIVGASGVGKTTLAHALSEKQNFAMALTNSIMSGPFKHSSSRIQNTHSQIKWIICSFAPNRNMNYARVKDPH